MLDSATLSLSLGLDMKGSFNKITENSVKKKVPFYYLNRKKTLLQYTTVIAKTKNFYITGYYIYYYIQDIINIVTGYHIYYYIQDIIKHKCDFRDKFT